MKQLFERLEIHGIETREIWDIGAYKGEWTLEIANYVPKAKFTLFEPNSIHNFHLNKTNARIMNVLLSDQNGESLFYSHGGTGDSLFPEYNEDLVKRSAYRIEKCVRIDTLIEKSQNLIVPDFVKIDVQGAELNVLKGAGKYLFEIKVILLECPIVHYNWGSPNIHDYLSFMYKSNFVPYFITEIHRLNEIITQIDIAFIQKKTFDQKVISLAKSGFWTSNEDRYLHSM